MEEEEEVEGEMETGIEGRTADSSRAVNEWSLLVSIRIEAGCDRSAYTPNASEPWNIPVTVSLLLRTLGLAT